MTTPSIAGIPGLQPFVELGAFTSGIPTGEAVWEVSTWDAVNWVSGFGYADPNWSDITCEVHAVEINAGRDRSIDRWQVGNATLTLNNATGWADIGTPTENDPLAFEVRPGRQIRFGVGVDGAAPQWMYRWFIDTVEPSYEPDQDSDIVTVACIDAKGQVGKVDMAKTASEVGIGDTVDVRINRALDGVLWAPGARDIVGSFVTLAGTTFGTQVVDVIDRAADSAGGVTYGDSTGRIAYRETDWQKWVEDVPPDATIGNVPATTNDVYEDGEHVTWFGDNVIFHPVANDVCPTGWELSFDLTDTATQVHVGRQGEPPWIYNDVNNQIRYGVETFTRTDLECTSNEVLADIGQQLLKALSADYMPNVAAVTLNAGTSTPARDLCVTVDPTVPSRYRCRLHRSGGRIVFDRQFFAVGVQHRIDPNGWETRIALDDAAPYMIASGLPGNNWSYAHWDTGNTWN